MKMSQIKKKAKSVGVEPAKLNKKDLIQSIQRAEGYPACFGTSNGQCPYIDCCFMDDCLKIKV